MTSEDLLARVRISVLDGLPVPGQGQTALRHQRLLQIGREDLSLARLAEAHCDALAILAEAGRAPAPNSIYGVWASENKNVALRLEQVGSTLLLHGVKPFCSGASLVDRALLTVQAPNPLLVDVDLRAIPGTVQFDSSAWKTDAFDQTRTATATFLATPVYQQDIIQGPGWYLSRPGFWHGACGPAACWAGGAAGLVDFAQRQSRDDPHTLAHLGAMQASLWAMQSYLESAGLEIDRYPSDAQAARIRALTVRHLVEQACTDILRRLPRAYGPYPLAMNDTISRRYKELDLYLRQSHAERDLESLGRDVKANFETNPPRAT